MTDLAIIAGVLLAVGCLCLAAAHSWRARRLTFLDWTVLAIGGVYGIGWAVVVYVTRAGANSRWEGFLLSNKAYFLLHTACVLVLLAGLVVGWRAGRGTVKSAPAMPPPIPAGRSGWSVEMGAAWLMLGLAVITQWLYTLSYGGFIGALTQSAAFRSGLLTTENRLGFLFPFGSLAYVASFIFFGLLLAGRRPVRLWISLVLAVAVSLYVLLLRLGRVDALVYLATFLFGYLMYRVNRPLTLLAISGLGGVAILAGTYWLSLVSGISFTEGLAAFLAKELAFPFVNFLEHSAAETRLRWFYDIVVMPVFLLPESLWAGWVENVSDVTTTLIKGAPKGTAGVSGGMPVDLLTLGLLQASVLGVLVVGFLFGLLLRFLDRLLLGVANQGVRAVFGAHIAFKIAVLGVFYAQPSLLVKGNMYVLVAALILWFSSVVVSRRVRMAKVVP